jgi:hypothetical protein
VARGALWPVRAASWLVLRPTEAATAYVERKNLYGRVYEALTSDDRLVGVRPVVLFDPGYALSGGLRYFDHRTLGPGSLLEASGEASVTLFRGRLALEPPGRTGLRLALIYERRTDAIFGGTDGESREDLESVGLDVVRYKRRAFQAMASWQRLIVQGLAFQLSGGYDHRDYDNGTSRRNDPPIEDVYCLNGAAPPCTVDPLLVPGFDEGLARAARRRRPLPGHARQPSLQHRRLRQHRGQLRSRHLRRSQRVRHRHGDGGGAPSASVIAACCCAGAPVRSTPSATPPPCPSRSCWWRAGRTACAACPTAACAAAASWCSPPSTAGCCCPGWTPCCSSIGANGYGASFDGLSLGDAFTSVGVGLVAVDLHDGRLLAHAGRASRCRWRWRPTRARVSPSPSTGSEAGSWPAVF